MTGIRSFFVRAGGHLAEGPTAQDSQSHALYSHSRDARVTSEQV